MTGGSRIVAIDAANAESVSEDAAVNTASEAETVTVEDWEAEEEAASPTLHRWPTVLGALVAIAAVAAWTAAFVIAHQPELGPDGTLLQWTAWIRDWSVPVLLVCVVWLLAMRNSRREAQRFGASARMLSEESARLETRLVTVNHELSLAREFITAQARDLEALGRVAGERLGEHADRLAGLISDNGKRIDTIGTVSEAALDNMEKLRFQLPVIASSAKDVTNNIGAAGRTAHAQIEEMVQGFNRLNQFGQASEQQVEVLRQQVDAALGEFTRQLETIEGTTQARFAALAEQSADFRARLDGHEGEALAAVRTRAAALGEELETTRQQLDQHEAESLTSLRARLTAVRDESAAITRALRDGEISAQDAWRRAITQLESDLEAAVTRVAGIDEQAMATARQRLAALAEEAELFDGRMAERDHTFAEAIETRRVDFLQRHAEFSETLTAQIAALDAEIAARRSEQEQSAQQLASHSETISAQLANFSARMAEIAAHGGEAEAAVARSLETLAERLVASRDALTGTDQIIAGLTDDSVRLLELIRAGVTHSEEDLPAAFASNEARLEDLLAKARTLRDVVVAAETHGDGLAAHTERAGLGLDHGMARAAELETALADRLAAIAGLSQSLDVLQARNAAVAEQAQAELAAAIAQLDVAARDAVAGIGAMSASEITALANRIGDESGPALDRAVRARAAEVAGQLEQAAAHAAGVSREAALQLRDQLGKVDELAGNLERRVTQARERAQEQVDNDFARRVALITESLNSASIDIARAMDADVTDTAWAAYLRGDRGIFTRRAVRLLDTPEAKAVVQLYESDRDFRDHVARYIHDFEAMLRQLLSARDGHAMGVTLLSSDMGKLYVALAQAIERLRR